MKCAGLVYTRSPCFNTIWRTISKPPWTPLQMPFVESGCNGKRCGESFIEFSKHGEWSWLIYPVLWRSCLNVWICHFNEPLNYVLAALGIFLSVNLTWLSADGSEKVFRKRFCRRKLKVRLELLETVCSWIRQRTHLRIGENDVRCPNDVWRQTNCLNASPFIWVPHHDFILPLLQLMRIKIFFRSRTVPEILLVAVVLQAHLLCLVSV